MNLKTFVDSERGASARLAHAIGVHPVMVSQWSTGAKKVPVKRCPVIEQITNGAVTCEELRPDVPWAVLRRQVAPGAAQAA